MKISSAIEDNLLLVIIAYKLQSEGFLHFALNFMKKSFLCKYVC